MIPPGNRIISGQGILIGSSDEYPNGTINYKKMPRWKIIASQDTGN
jgi:hypothetical protein